MAKKSKLQRKRQQAKLSPIKLRDQGLMLVQKGHYKAGIVLLEKTTITESYDDEIRMALVQAYDASMLTYMQIGEYKTAIKLLTKRLCLLVDGVNVWCCLDIFLRNRLNKQALAFYIEHLKEFSTPSIKEKQILSQFIPYIFVNFNSLPEIFKTTNFYHESEYAYTLFNQTVITGNVNDEQIKQIGLLSPYKDLRILLRVLQQLKSGHRAESLLTKIKKESVFHELAVVLRATYEDPYIAFSLLKNMSHAGLRLFRRLKNMDEKKSNLLVKIMSNSHSGYVTDHDMFKMIVKNPDAFGKQASSLAKSQLWKIENGCAQYKRVFGELSVNEQLKYDALWHEEDHGGCEDAKRDWKKLAINYRKQKKNRPKAGMLYQYLAEHYAESPVAKIKYYKKAINNNPKSIGVYHLLIETQMMSEKMTDATLAKSIAQAINAFPHDIKLKELSLKYSLQKGNAEKTIALALSTLKMHPASKYCREIIRTQTIIFLLASANQGHYDRIAPHIDTVVYYLSAEDKLCLQALMFIGSRLNKTLPREEGCHNATAALQSEFWVLSCAIQGLLLGHSLKKQMKVMPGIKEKLPESLHSLEMLSRVLLYFKGAITRNTYADVTPLITHALTLSRGSYSERLKFGLLLEDLELHKPLKTYAKQFNNSSLEEEASILYFNTIKNTKAKNRMHTMRVIDTLLMMRDRLGKQHLLHAPLNKLISRLSKGIMPTGLRLPGEILRLLEQVP